MMTQDLGTRPGGLFFHPSDQPAQAVFAVDLQNYLKMRDLLRPLGEALDFPAWYGANLDALFDCLADPAWLEDGGVVRLYGLSALQSRDTEGWLALREVFESACLARQEDGSAPLTLLVDVDADALPHWTGA